MEKDLYRIHVKLTKEEYNELLKQKEFLGYSTYAQLI
jgi:hypothetical protein